MSKNSKQRNKAAAAKQYSSVRKSGGSGPASTIAAHGKKNAWFQTLGHNIASRKKTVRGKKDDTAAA